MLRLAAILCLSAGAGQAMTLMTAEDFEAWSTGHTLDYRIDGQLWGSEQHFPGRQTLDADVGASCLAGQWFPRDDAICFVYDAVPGQHCWRFWRDGERVIAEIADSPDAPVAEVTLSDTPLACPGPDVGA